VQALEDKNSRGVLSFFSEKVFDIDSGKAHIRGKKNVILKPNDGVRLDPQVPYIG
jgi:hypothetical protein